MLSIMSGIGQMLMQSMFSVGGDYRYHMRYEASEIVCAAYSHDSQQLFVGITNYDHQYYNSDRPPGHHIHYWQYDVRKKDFRPVTWMPGHSGRINWLLVTPDDHWLLSGSADGTVRLWAVETRKLHKTLSSHGRAVTCGILNATGTLLVTGDGQGLIIVWQVPGGQIVHELRGHEQAIQHLILTADGGSLISACEAGRIIEWTLDDTEVRRVVIDEGNIQIPTKSGDSKPPFATGHFDPTKISDYPSLSI